MLTLIICIFSGGTFAVVRTRLSGALEAQIRDDLVTVERVYREKTGDLGELDHRMGVVLLEVVEGAKIIHRTAGWPPSGPTPYRVRTIADGLHHVSVARDEGAARETLRILIAILVTGVPVAIIVAIGGGYVLAGRMLSRVSTMAETARKISAESLGRRLPVENLLTLTRAESGRIALARTKVDLGERTANVSDQLRVLADEKEQTLHLDAGTLVSAECDPAVIRQALINLLHNAITYTPIKDAIHIAVRETSSSTVAIEVGDSGPGIAAIHREKIFQRFYRVDAGRAGEAGGVGLGLPIARWAVEANGGCIELETEEGRGSLFRIVLPRSGCR